MNKKRRSALNAVLNELERLRGSTDRLAAIKLLQTAQMTVECCADEEQEALDNRPESLRWTATTDDMTDNVSDLYDAAADLEILAEQITEQEEFNYEPIKVEIVNIVNNIKQVIHR